MEERTPPLPVKLLADDRVGDYMVDADGDTVDFNTHGLHIVRAVNAYAKVEKVVSKVALSDREGAIEYFLRAVDAHDELLARLASMAVSFHHNGDHGGYFRDCGSQVCEENRETIDKAEGR